MSVAVGVLIVRDKEGEKEKERGQRVTERARAVCVRERARAVSESSPVSRE